MKHMGISFVAYDTICRIEAEADDKSYEVIAGILVEAREIAYDVQKTLSIFSANSELSVMCATYTPLKPYKLSPMLYAFLSNNLTMAAISNGAFDPTVGPLMNLWKSSIDSNKVPTDEEVCAARERIGYRHLSLDEKDKSIVFNREGMQLDPGASGKGFALGLVVKYLKENGISNAVADFGGNLYVLGGRIGSMSPETPTRVGIRDPNRNNEIMGILPLLNRGIGTSSWYENFFKIDGRIYHHLINPKDGRPVNQDIESVSIISSSAIYTDLLSTAFFVSGIRDGIKLSRRIETVCSTNIDYVAMCKDGRVLVSKGTQFESNKK